MISPNFPLPLIMQVFENGRRALLQAPFVFSDVDDGGPFNIEVPAGFETDFNSVPRGLWNFFPPWEYPEAGVVHDYLYRNPDFTDRGWCDAQHRRILELLGCPRWKRWAAYAALRAAGWNAWHKIPDEGAL